MEYNDDQLRELIRCRGDIEYFADNYIKISSPDGAVQVHLNDFQRRVVENYNDKRAFFMHADRQEGKSTIAAIILLHQAIFQECRTSVVFARVLSMSNYILKLIVEMYDQLPEFIRTTKIITRNKGNLAFDNGYSVISSGSNANICKGMTITTVYIDESEWFDEMDDVLESIYPCIASITDAKIFALSSTLTQDTFRMLGLV